MTTGTAEIRSYYQDFSLTVGARDWREPNWRHETLRLHLDDLLGGARGLRILDLGCGAGVMTSFLCRYGRVTGTDFSVPAIRLAAAMEPRARFVPGSLDDLPDGDRYDLITLFDVLEHVPPDDRRALFERLGRLLAPGGWIALSTPHPTFLRRMRAERPDLMQVVDEPVDPDVVLELASAIGRELVAYRSYDVDWPDVRQYQFIALAPPAGIATPLYRPQRGHRLRARLLAASTAPGRRMRTIGHAGRLIGARRPRAALWVLGLGSRPPA